MHLDAEAEASMEVTNLTSSVVCQTAQTFQRCSVVNKVRHERASRVSSQLKYNLSTVGLSPQGISFSDLFRSDFLQYCSKITRERERERFTTSIQPAWLMRTGLCSCLSLLQQGNVREVVMVPE